ncbi:MAG: 2-oxoglutarate dehydrogenase E1 component [Myxococcota bacterium]
MSRETIFEAFRRWGYLQARLDDLGRLTPVAHPALDHQGADADAARAIYCGPIGVELAHIADPQRVAWVVERMETPPREPDRQALMRRLLRAQTFEHMLQARYVGTKRYGLEGSMALIALLDACLERASDLGAEKAILGMAHRGRLNVMLNVIEKPAVDIFTEFEDVDPTSVLGSGDVKYHLGATGTRTCKNGRTLRLALVSNPSHLEAVDPVVIGRARAHQDRYGDGGTSKVLPITLHGDAAFAGQGLVAETLNFCDLEGFSVGGTLRVITNNLIGFTTNPKALHSSRYSSDVAKRLDVPIFHVNGADPEAVVRVGEMAVDFRYAFGTDAVIDLIAFRRYGHSEVDDPTITQPLLYEKIQKRAPLWQLYAERIGVGSDTTDALVTEVRKEFDAAIKEARERTKPPALYELPSYWRPYRGGPRGTLESTTTALEPARLHEISERMTSLPAGFTVHPKLERYLAQRAAMLRGERPVDWGTAELLAFASLLWDGTPVRLTGEDVQRGTFNQRHAVLIDNKTEAPYAPLAHLHDGQARFSCFNSALSELGGAGFEYGYSRDYPEALVLWEAQFGDFANGAQIIFDQFLSAGEDKWALLSGLVLLLPHGFEGQGPEHSSARIERFLQLCAEDNMQVCYPTTAAQHFHLLRRQALQPWRKPLVIFTPKGMLRHPDMTSPLDALAAGEFSPVLVDPEVRDAQRILVATGKIAHELRTERQRLERSRTAIVTLEQLYPFPRAEISAALEAHPRADEILWVQEEPANMGALSFVVPRLQQVAGNRFVRSVKRSASASPATGSPSAHQIEQKTLLRLAFESGSRSGEVAKSS